VLEIELRIGDMGGDLAERGFQTVDHEPCPAGALTVSMQHSIGPKNDPLSCGAGVPNALREMVADPSADWATGWDAAKALRVADLAERWHLNTMRAWCSHTGPDIGVGAAVGFPTMAGGWLHVADVVTYAGDKDTELVWVDSRTGEVWPERPQYQNYEGSALNPAFTDDLASYHEQCVVLERAGGHRTVERRPTADAHEIDHYTANRCRVCPTGYVYGSSWLVELLPADVEAQIRAL
jgi:hypothetical protein